MKRTNPYPRNKELTPEDVLDIYTDVSDGGYPGEWKMAGKWYVAMVGPSFGSDDRPPDLEVMKWSDVLNWTAAANQCRLDEPDADASFWVFETK